jgi:nitrate reductase gamma subunit
MSILQLTTYGAVVFFFVAVMIKIVGIARLPIHLRWDLYPIPHEKGKSRYGGSYFEDPAWWQKPQRKSLSAEIREMAVEIFFLRGVFRNNRPLWFFSYPFHLGLYALVGLVVCLKLSVILSWGSVSIDGAGVGLVPRMLHTLTIVLAASGWFLTFVGGLGLLGMRLFRSDLRSYSTPGDYLNLFLLLAVSGTGLFDWVMVDRDCTFLRAFMSSLVFVRPPAVPIPSATVCLLWMTDVLLLYFPFTHMTHFAGKFFTYHTVRWADTPNRPGSRLEKELTASADRPVTWAGPHIDPQSSWKQAAAGPKRTDDQA